MKLVDLLSLIDQNIITNVCVIDEDPIRIETYDGKNSIDEELNDCEVATISIKNNQLIIDVLKD